MFVLVVMATELCYQRLTLTLYPLHMVMWSGYRVSVSRCAPSSKLIIPGI